MSGPSTSSVRRLSKKSPTYLGFKLCLFSLVIGFAGPAYSNPRGEKKLGFTICGIKPGIALSEMQNHLKGWRFDVVDITAPSRTVFFQDGSGRHLLVKLTGRNHKEFVEQLTYFPVNNSFTLELDGKVLLAGVETVTSVRRKLGVRPSVGDMIGLQKGGAQLTLRLNLSRQVLQSATLVKVENSGK